MSIYFDLNSNSVQVQIAWEVGEPNLYIIKQIIELRHADFVDIINLRFIKFSSVLSTLQKLISSKYRGILAIYMQVLNSLNLQYKFGTLK